MQTRFFNYGQTYYSPQHNDARYGVMAPGPYRGFGLSVDTAAPTNLVISDGYGVLHDGYEWKEDASTTLAFAPQNPADTFTICATHTDRLVMGGASVAYEIRTGYFSTIADGVVLGWIYYPGAFAVLASSHLVKAPNLLLTSYVADLSVGLPIERIAPFHNQNSCYTDVAGMDINLTLTPLLFDVADYVLYQDISRGGGGGAPPVTAMQHMQYYMDTYRPKSFTFYNNISGPATTNLSVQVFDTSQAPVGAPILVVGTGAWMVATVAPAFADISAATFDYGKPYTLRLIHSLDLNQSIKLAKITANFWPF